MTHFKQFIFILLVALLSLSACSKKPKHDVADYPHLQYIPANTPYAFMSLEPLPEKIADHFYQAYDEIIVAYSNIIQSAFADIQSDLETSESKLNFGKDNIWVEAIKKEFDGGFDLEKIESFGFDKRSVGSFYGHGVMPVFRIKMKDTGLFNQAMTRIEKNAGAKIPTLDVKDMTVWSIGKDSGEHKIKLLVATSDEDLVLSLLPEGADENYLQQLLGVQLPKQSLANSSSVSDLMKNKAYLPQGLGFIDFREILNRVIEAPDGIDKELFDLFDIGNKSEQLSAVCKSELKEMANNVPRLIYGITTLNRKELASESVLEVRKEIASEMINLAAPVPGLGEAAGFFSMGFSFDIAEIRNFANARIDAISENPYECEYLQIEDGKLAKAKQSINNPAAGFVESLRGFNIVVDDIDSSALATLLEIEDGEKPDLSSIQEILNDKFSANAVLAVDNTKTIINMAKMFSPEIAEMELEANGKPVLVNDFLPQPLPMDVYVTIDKSAFAFTMGKDAKSRPGDIFKLKENPNPPILSYSLNWQQYMTMLNTIFDNEDMQAEMSKDGDVDPEDIKAIINAVGKLFESMTYSMGFREDGVVIKQSIELTD
jgi:hypothetical protein